MDARPIRPLDSSSHVAQQSRRDKLRVLGSVDGDFPTNTGHMLPPDHHHSLHSSSPNPYLQTIVYRDGNGNEMAAPPNQLLVSQDCTASEHYAEPHNVDGLRLYPHHHSPNWVETGSNSSRASSQNLVYVRQVLSANSMVATNSMPAHPPSDISVLDTRPKHQGNADNFPSRCYPDTLVEFVSPAAIALEMNSGNELALLPAYGRDQLNALGCDNMVAWNNHSAEVASNRGIGDTNAQSLSLTLSSNPSSSLLMIRDAQDSSDNYAYNSNYSNSITKPSIMDRKPANALYEVMGISASGAEWNTGPLGPFTGYATILKSSKFLKPAQDLLEDLCQVTFPKPVEMHVMLERISQESFMGSSNGEASNSLYNFTPEDNQKREPLLLMLDEVCRRYRQYHQQMQMVVSSFETVAGLSAATPYISLALKTVARNFRCLKNAISEHLLSMKKSSGNTLLSPNTGPSTSKENLDSPKMVNSSQVFTKSRYLGDNMGFPDVHQHVWRPQRGLPERSVAILRAWLFEHFLHPYPTDMDKHMLATQASLTRNQVSNWFINARVRLWKPLVEEIHALETKRLAEANPSAAPIQETALVEVSSRREAMGHQPSSSDRVDDRYMLPVGAAERLLYGSNAEQLSHQELCSQLEGQLPVSSEGPLIGFMRYPHGGIEYGGFGPVSLSLGLQHNNGSQRRDDGLKQHYGGELFRNFVGGT